MNDPGYHEDDALWEGKFDRHIFLRLLTYVRPHLWLVALIFALVVLITVLQLALPYALRLVVDDVTPGATTRTIWGRAAGHGELFRAFALAFLLCELLRFAIDYGQFFLLQVLGQRVIIEVRMDLFGALQRMPMAFFHRQPVGRLVTRLAFDVENLTQMFSEGLITVVKDLFLVAGISLALLLVDLHLGLLVLCVMPALIGVTIGFRYLIRWIYREVARRRSALNAYTAENLDGMREVQAFGREAACRARHGELNEELLRTRLSVIHRWGMFEPAFMILGAVATALVISVVGAAVLKRELPLGVFAQFFFLVRLLVNPLRSLAEKYNIMQQAMASADRIFKMMDNPPSPALATPDTAHPAPRGRLDFEHVDFAYTPGEPVLRDVCFTIEPGQSVALVGHTGAGKSTVINLLGRFWDVDRGRIALDGSDLREWHPHRLRRQITVVSQDVFLFAGDIRFNIALGDDYPQERIEAAARAVGAHEFITALPGGYVAEVVEGGATLSAGQRQLIGFARAILRDTPILALDEATSSIDTRTEGRIQQALQTVTRGRTSIIIAHRLSTIQRCDRILLLHEGRVVEQGTHQELLARRGRYHKLYRLQFAEPGPRAARRQPG